MNLWTSITTRNLLRRAPYLALLPLTLNTGMVQAQAEEARWFEVEVILFSNNVTLESTNENWEDQISPVDLNKTDDLLASVLFPTPKEAAPVPVECQQAITGLTQAPTQVDDQVTDLAEVQTEQTTTEQNDVTAAQSVPTSDNAIDCSQYQASANDVKVPGPADYEKLPTLVIGDTIPEWDQTAYLLTKDLLQMGDALQKLSARGEYQPLLHTAWRQPVLGRRAATPMRLYAGQNFTGQFEYDGKAVVESLPEELTTSADETEQAKEQQDSVSNLQGEDGTAPAPDFDAFLAEQDAIAEQHSASLDQAGQSEELQLASEEALAQEPLPPVNPDGTPNQVWQLDGSLRIYLEHYLYIESKMNLRRQGEREMKLEQLTQEALKSQEISSDIAATPPPEQALPEETAAEVIPLQEFSGEGSLVAEARKEPYLFAYHMDQFRRVRSNELHYFDHPLVGMLIQIRPYDMRPEPEPEIIDTAPVSEATVEASAPASESEQPVQPDVSQPQ